MKKMTINASDIVTEICDISSLYELLGKEEQLGEPCLLFINTDSSTVLGRDASEKEAVRSFLAQAHFMTAVAYREGTPEEVTAAADMAVKADEAASFIEKLFKDKTAKQVREINSCFIAARTSGAKDVLDAESRAFYRLMADKNGGGANE